MADPLPPWSGLFEERPSSKRLPSIRTKTSYHKNSFFPTAVSLINNAHKLLFQFTDSYSVTNFQDSPFKFIDIYLALSM